MFVWAQERPNIFSMSAWLASIEADPLAGLAVFKNSSTVVAASRWLGWPYLPAHLHEILLFAALHLAIYAACGPILARYTRWYAPLPRATKIGLAVHASSEFNALSTLALSFPLFFSTGLDSLVSYTPYAGFVAAALSGYFLFDVIASFLSIETNGWGFLLHALTALFVFLQGNRPFLHNYCAAFVWFEASTPFVNVNWLATNVPNLISKKAQTINGALLIIVFFLCRIVPGPINGYRLFTVAFTTHLPGVPLWLVVGILGCYILLTALNFFWFAIMLEVAYSVLFKKIDASAESVERQAEMEAEAIGGELGVESISVLSGTSSVHKRGSAAKKNRKI